MTKFSPGVATEKTLYVIEHEGFLFFCIPGLYPKNKRSNSDECEFNFQLVQFSFHAKFNGPIILILRLHYKNIFFS